MADKAKHNVIEMGKDNSQILALRQVANAIVSRATLFAKYGKSFQGHRDIYTACGYVLNPDFDDYYARYDRDGIGKRIVSAPVTGCWKKKPTIYESEDKRDNETPFEKAVNDLIKNYRLFHYLQRLDLLSGIGRYGVLLFGLSDGIGLDLPVSMREGRSLLFLRPYHEGHAEIERYVDQPNDPRYGLPEYYKLMTTGKEETQSKTLRVHWSRVIHVAEDLLENDIFGTPRLKPVLNRCEDLERIVASSSEGFWRNAFPILNFKADSDIDLTSIDTDDWEDEIEAVVHDLKRYIKTQGLSVEAVAGQLADPSSAADVVLKLISGATRIPVRILVGSERGELASSQDDKNWAGRLTERREDHVEPTILRPTIDKLIELGIVPAPSEDDYIVEWPDISVPSEKEQSEVNDRKMSAVQKYTSSPGTERVIPLDFFQRKFLGFTQDEVDEIAMINEQEQEEEDLEIERDEENLNVGDEEE